MTEVVRPYRGVSAEDRRGQRRTQLLGAALDVVADVGVSDATTEAVCARAGLSKRYFYESFADREAILVAVLDDLFERVSAAIAELIEASADLPEDQRVRRTVEVLVRELSADPRAARVYVEAPRHPALEQRRLRAYDDFAQLILDEHVLNVEADESRAY
ncbi:MAG TPA: TetR/AcrR family transcriptional regulator, partial [Nocardioidaceae bacterium]|nr:TetR/AcrR family transcriptional regulator [Nocardioidaceae bacterium]